MTEVYCLHCHWSEWANGFCGLTCAYPSFKGMTCPEHAHHCPAYQREPGADDDKGET